MAAPKQRKQQQVRHGHPHVVSDSGDHRARLCLPQDVPLASAPHHLRDWIFDFSTFCDVPVP